MASSRVPSAHACNVGIHGDGGGELLGSRTSSAATDTSKRKGGQGELDLDEARSRGQKWQRKVERNDGEHGGKESVSGKVSHFQSSREGVALGEGGRGEQRR